MSKGLFVSATATDAGKTFIAALMVKKLRDAGYKAGYYKAALSGAKDAGGKLVPGDAEYVRRVAGIRERPEDMVSYIYKAEVSPHLAAKIEGCPPETEKITADYRKICRNFDYITVEGSGGIVCPLRYGDKEIMLTDVVKLLDTDMVVVSSAGLGSINSAVLTVKYAASQGIEVKGIILNKFLQGDFMEEDNKFMIEELTGVKVIACVPEGAAQLDIEPAFLASLYRQTDKI